MCVGLDPDTKRFPEYLRGQPDSIFAFCKNIIDSTADLVCAFKPQIAYFHAARAENQLEDICSYIRENYPDIPVILDAKRGDIGATAQQYAREVFERYNADAVTLSPYMDSTRSNLIWNIRARERLFWHVLPIPADLTSSS